MNNAEYFAKLERDDLRQELTEVRQWYLSAVSKASQLEQQLAEANAARERAEHERDAWQQEAEINDGWLKRHAAERDEAEGRARYAEIERDNALSDTRKARERVTELETRLVEKIAYWQDKLERAEAAAGRMRSALKRARGFACGISQAVCPRNADHQTLAEELVLKPARQLVADIDAVLSDPTGEQAAEVLAAARTLINTPVDLDTEHEYLLILVDPAAYYALVAAVAAGDGSKADG